jgi:hypothetical protein
MTGNDLVCAHYVITAIAGTTAAEYVSYLKCGPMKPLRDWLP